MSLIRNGRMKTNHRTSAPVEKRAVSSPPSSNLIDDVPKCIIVLLICSTLVALMRTIVALPSTTHPRLFSIPQITGDEGTDATGSALPLTTLWLFSVSVLLLAATGSTSEPIVNDENTATEMTRQTQFERQHNISGSPANWQLRFTKIRPSVLLLMPCVLLSDLLYCVSLWSRSNEQCIENEFFAFPLGSRSGMTQFGVISSKIIVFFFASSWILFDTRDVSCIFFRRSWCRQHLVHCILLNMGVFFCYFWLGNFAHNHFMKLFSFACVGLSYIVPASVIANSLRGGKHVKIGFHGNNRDASNVSNNKDHGGLTVSMKLLLPDEEIHVLASLFGYTVSDALLFPYNSLCASEVSQCRLAWSEPLKAVSEPLDMLAESVLRSSNSVCVGAEYALARTVVMSFVILAIATQAMFPSTHPKNNQISVRHSKVRVKNGFMARKAFKMTGLLCRVIKIFAIITLTALPFYDLVADILHQSLSTQENQYSLRGVSKMLTEAMFQLAAQVYCTIFPSVFVSSSSDVNKNLHSVSQQHWSVSPMSVSMYRAVTLLGWLVGVPLLSVAVFVGKGCSGYKIPVTIVRKMFHLIAVACFTHCTLSDPAFMLLSYVLALVLMSLLEWQRYRWKQRCAATDPRRSTLSFYGFLETIDILFRSVSPSEGGSNSFDAGRAKLGGVSDGNVRSSGKQQKQSAHQPQQFDSQILLFRTHLYLLLGLVLPLFLSAKYYVGADCIGCSTHLGATQSQIELRTASSIAGQLHQATLSNSAPEHVIVLLLLPGLGTLGVFDAFAAICGKLASLYFNSPSINRKKMSDEKLFFWRKYTTRQAGPVSFLYESAPVNDCDEKKTSEMGLGFYQKQNKRTLYGSVAGVLFTFFFACLLLINCNATENTGDSSLAAHAGFSLHACLVAMLIVVAAFEGTTIGQDNLEIPLLMTALSLFILS